MTFNSTEQRSRILFVSHREEQCGVYQYGLNIAKAIQKSTKYLFKYLECSNPDDFINGVANIKPSAIIYNYHPSTLPWLSKKIISKTKVTNLGIIHEVTQKVADLLDDELFDYHIAPDPTLLLKNTIVLKTGRLIPAYINTLELPPVPIIGSFGFGLQGKGFEQLIATVQQEYDRAEIRLHIPFAAFGDSKGEQAITIAKFCQDLVFKPEIKLSISHKFLNQDELLDFLAQNTLNAFFYDKYYGRGISSVIDYALAVQRPIAITRSTMFRHIISASPSICIENSSLKQIIANGIDPLKSFCKEWNESNLIWDYERIIDQVLNTSLLKEKKQPISLKSKMRSLASKYLKDFKLSTQKNQWIGDADTEVSLDSNYGNKEYKVPEISDVKLFNRILDNQARKQYQPIITFLFAVAPEIIRRKIPEANVQQAFVLDTVLKFYKQLSLPPKILCIGSYEDTAALAVKKIGLPLEEIDPVFNYNLETFFSKPSTLKGSYDIIFSTSVLEHVPDDELFMTQIAELLAPGGTAVLTCDYNDQYQPGDPIPDVDFRFYTQKDFKQRLLPLLKDCSLFDDPQWDCPNPDFTYAGYYKYTFATLVFQKHK